MKTPSYLLFTQQQDFITLITGSLPFPGFLNTPLLILATQFHTESQRLMFKDQIPSIPRQCLIVTPLLRCIFFNYDTVWWTYTSRVSLQCLAILLQDLAIITNPSLWDLLIAPQLSKRIIYLSYSGCLPLEGCFYHISILSHGNIQQVKQCQEYK